VYSEQPLRAADPVTDWADSPAHEADDMPAETGSAAFASEDSDEPSSDDAYDGDDDFANVAPLDAAPSEDASPADLPQPDFGHFGLDDDDEEYDEDEGEAESPGYSFASLADYIEPPVKKAIDPSEFALDPYVDASADADYAAIADDDDAPFVAELPADAGIYDCLASARELARTADTTEDRSRSALYAAVSRAYDFSLAAEAAPDDYAELVAESGLTVQERAPMTPVVKLVFGHDYDKTRLTEYAAVLSHAHRIGLERGRLADFLAETEGGVKAVVKAERRMRREEQGKPVDDPAAVREALAQQLRALEAIMLEELDGAGPEFALALIRRDETGCAAILAEVPEDIAQIERAARKLFG
jgi:hypothetical protein